jgi:hypothetical protein
MAETLLMTARRSPLRLFADGLTRNFAFTVDGNEQRYVELF